MAKLTPKQKRFVEEFCVDFNATQAAIRAGYSPKSARTTSARLLAKGNIQAAISVLQEEASKRNEVTVDDIIQELKFIAFSRLTDAVSWDDSGVYVKSSEELDDSAIAAIQSVKNRETITENATITTVEVKQYDKLTALEKLARRLGFYDTQPPAAPIKIQIVEAIPDFGDDEDGEET